MFALDEISLRRAFVRYHVARRSPEHAAAYDAPEPRVTVIIATLDRAALLRERSLRSVLCQSYRNLEVLVVGDGCRDDSAAAVASFNDRRARFINLEGRMDYQAFGGPAVQGTRAINHAQAIATGEFITHLDDADEMLGNRIAVCVQHCQQQRLDLLFHSFLTETAEGRWARVSCPDGRPRYGGVTAGAVFYHRFFKDLPWDMEAWLRWQEPGDWNRFRKMALFQPSMGYLQEDLLIHHRDGAQAQGHGSQVAAMPRVHMGCGERHLPGWVNMDWRDLGHPDIHVDPAHGLPLADASVGSVVWTDALPQGPLDPQWPLVKECWRVLRAGGRLRLAGAPPDLDLALIGVGFVNARACALAAEDEAFTGLDGVGECPALEVQKADSTAEAA